MAESSSTLLLSTFQKHIEDMRNLTQCKICIKPLYEPYILACGHTYCYSCLTSWFGGSNSRKKERNCPDCRAVVAAQPAPNYLLRDLVHMFVNRTELLPEDETVYGHEIGKQEESSQMMTDRAGQGLFRGAFKSRVTPADVWPYPRTIHLAPIRDVEDGVTRCPECAWELEEGHCNQCGYDEDEEAFSSDDEEDDSDRDSLESQDLQTIMNTESNLRRMLQEEADPDFYGNHDDFDSNHPGSSPFGYPSTPSHHPYESDNDGSSVQPARHFYGIYDSDEDRDETPQPQTRSRRRNILSSGSEDEDEDEDEDEEEMEGFVVNDDEPSVASSPFYRRYSSVDARPSRQAPVIHETSSDVETDLDQHSDSDSPSETSIPRSEPGSTPYENSDSDDDSSDSEARSETPVPRNGGPRRRLARVIDDDDDDDDEEGHEESRSLSTLDSGRQFTIDTSQRQPPPQSRSDRSQHLNSQRAARRGMLSRTSRSRQRSGSSEIVEQTTPRGSDRDYGGVQHPGWNTRRTRVSNNPRLGFVA